VLLHARVVLPVSSPAITDGAVAVHDDRIAALGLYEELRSAFPRAEQIDLTDCVLLPGLINAHSHLDLSALKGLIPYRGSFIDWIVRLVAARDDAAGDLAETIADACRQSLSAGVTTIGDISSKNRTWRYVAQQPIRKTCFAEVTSVGGSPAQSREYLANCIIETRPDELLRLGLSPHAPYSTGPEIYELTARLAAQHNLSLTTHLAETAAEDEFLQQAAGPWRDLLDTLGAWPGSFECPHTSPIKYLLNLDLADQPFILAHVNYADNDDLAALAAAAHSVVYCPRSHAFFQHPPHPWQKMLEMGINVCLGTDSLASNSSLSILDELRFLHQRFAECRPRTLLQMATLNAARALNWQDEIGSIAPNKSADLIAVPLTDPHAVTGDTALMDILESTASPTLTMVAGRIAHRIPPL